jgi:battenin
MNNQEEIKDEEALVQKDEKQKFINAKTISSNLVFKAKITLFFLGLLNNSGYVVVLSAAKDLAEHFQKEYMISIFSGCLVFFSIGVKLFNAKYLLQIHHKIRIGIAVSFFLIGVINISFALENENFFLCLFGCMLLGIGGAIGDANIQGFIKGFPSETFTGYSSGTGGAGVFGSYYYLALKIYEFDSSQIFKFLFPAYIIYFFCFLYLVQQKVKLDINNDTSNSAHTGVEDKEASINQKLSLAIIPKIIGNILFYSVNFGLVYFFEYSIFGYLGTAASKKIGNTSFAGENVLPVLMCFYQTSVFFSRSSLQLIKISKVEVLTIIQGTLFVIWFCCATIITVPIWGLIGLMIMTGVTAGFSYVNVIYMILNDHQINKGEKEVSLNLNGMFADVAILTNSLCGFIFNKIIL